MEAKLASIVVYVQDQESAEAFYTTKLGFEVTADVSTPDGFRWLAVAGSRWDTELVLLPIGSGMGMAPNVMDAIRTVQESGLMSACILHVADCRATYQELSERGVRFVVEPHEEFYGVEARCVDDSGNAINIVQPTEM